MSKAARLRLEFISVANSWRGESIMSLTSELDMDLDRTSSEK